MTDQELKEAIADLVATQKEAFRETDRILKENALRMQETDRLIKENSKMIGGISNSNGAFAESFFFHSLEKSKTFAGIHFDLVDENFKRSKKMLDGTRLKDQFDIVMINDDSVAIIEIKYSSDSDYIKKMIEKKVPNFKFLFSDYADYKIYLGLGAMSFDKRTIKEAEKYGVGLVKISGEAIEYKTDWVRAY
jgi:hypothetical protein